MICPIAQIRHFPQTFLKFVSLGLVDSAEQRGINQKPTKLKKVWEKLRICDMGQFIKSVYPPLQQVSFKFRLSFQFNSIHTYMVSRHQMTPVDTE